MSRQWTDADVARMLGWYFEPDGRYRPCKYGEVNLEFGLSTPPGPDADANAARYVLPWLRSRGAYVNINYTAVQYQVDLSLQHDGGDMRQAEGEFSTALCTAGLEAYHTERQDNGK